MAVVHFGARSETRNVSAEADLVVAGPGTTWNSDAMAWPFLERSNEWNVMRVKQSTDLQSLELPTGPGSRNSERKRPPTW